MTNNSHSAFHKYLKLLENKQFHHFLQTLVDKNNSIISHEIEYIKHYLLNVEQNSTHELDQNIKLKANQVLNFLEGYLILPQNHLSRIGVTTDAHRYINEYFEDGY